MLIAQVTDVHLGFGAGGADEPNARRFAEVLARLRAMEPCPDRLFITGDLTENGDAASYALLGEMVAGMPFPVHLGLGNHDLREPFAAAFPAAPLDDGGFAQHAVEEGEVRCIVLDTLEQGRHGGGFCERRGAWLSRTLAQAPDRPTLILLHHPPVAVGIGWMDPRPDEPWIGRLTAALDGHRQVIGLVAGHVHRPTLTQWRGAPLVIAPSCAPEVALELAPIDPDRPDDRPMIVDGPPGLALHRWDGTCLISYIAWTPGKVVARFDRGLQPLVQAMIGEKRPAGD